MLAVLQTPIEDPIIFRWAKEQLEDEQKVQQFQKFYIEKKKNKSTAHLLNCIAFGGIGGIHRFYMGDIGLGIAHLLTCGFCWIGTFLDFVNINQRINEANTRMAMQTLEIVCCM